MRFLFVLFLAVSIFNTGLAQEKKQLTPEQVFQKEYAKRIKKERLYGVYIPKDVPDAFGQLNRLTAQESRTVFKGVSEEMAVKKLHFSLGRWIIHNWGFYGGSRLSHNLKLMGVTHPDDQARVIITAYHRYLNKTPLKLKELADGYQGTRQKVILEKKKKGAVISKEKRKKANE